jgi:DNA replication protein DnaC
VSYREELETEEQHRQAAVTEGLAARYGDSLPVAEVETEAKRRVFFSRRIEFLVGVESESGLRSPALSYRRHVAGWDDERLARERQEPGWGERLTREGEELSAAVVAAAIAKELGGILRSGLATVARMPQAQRLELVADKRLRRCATAYDPFKEGGRLVLGPTAAGKSVACVSVVYRLLADAAGNRWRASAQERESTVRYLMAGGNPFHDAPDESVQGPNGKLSIKHLLRGDRRSYSFLELGRDFSLPRKTIAWFRATDLPRAVLQCKLGEEPADVKKAMEADFLVLDDLGWESRRADADSVLTDVLMVRYDTGRPTLVTSGLTFEEFRSRYRDPIIRRIVECAGVNGDVIDLWPKEPK